MARLSKKNEELLKAVQKQAVRRQDDQVSGNSQSPSAVGLGVDLVEIERMEQAIKRTPRILERVFTSGEREYAWSKPRPATHYAAFFAAREAVLKALGTGFRGMGFADVEIQHDQNGKPEVLLHGRANEIAEEQGVVEIQISLSHTHQMAVASAVAIKAQSSPRKPQTYDPMEELAQRFKELRSLLDEVDALDVPDGEDTGNITSGGAASALKHSAQEQIEGLDEPPLPEEDVDTTKGIPAILADQGSE